MPQVSKRVQSFKEDKIVRLSSYDERRQHPRYSVKLPIELWQTPDVVLRGVVTDMSEIGLGIRSIHEIQISAELRIRVYVSRVYLSKEGYRFEGIEGTGRIVWRTAHREQDWEGYRYGMYIMRMALDSRDRLMKYILMLQGEENSSTRKRLSDRL
jgi:PilZ domain